MKDNKITHIKFGKREFDIIICIDGDLPDSIFFNEFNSVKIIAADGAANSLIINDIIPNYVIGDLDSLNADLINSFSDKLEIIQDYDQGKNDFEKALNLALEFKAQNVLVVGLHGGELEHTLNNMSVFLKFSDKFNLTIYDLRRYGFIIKGNNILNIKKNELISLIPQAFAKLDTQNLKWNISNESLEIGKREGARNIAISDWIQINVLHGKIMFFCDQRVPYAPEKVYI